MSARAFKQVDVFTSVPLLGNALAVVLDAQGLSGADMQRIAAWTNLSETSFVLPPTTPAAHYRLRIFTPRSELPFAGHPSVGTAHALLEAGRIPTDTHLVQECAAGLLPISIEGSGSARRIFVQSPTARVAPIDPVVVTAAATALGPGFPHDSAPRVVNVGPNWLICDLADAANVRSLAPDSTAVAALCAQIAAVGVSVFGRARGADFGLVVRAFCPGDGFAEDPVTGSANAAIGAYLRATDQLGELGANYRVSQGREVGRDGFVDVRVDKATGTVAIGGQSVTCIDGMLDLGI
jgi:PhzF family phenazine biosynthesis protein